MQIVEAKVRPERESLPPKNDWNRGIAERWWLWGAYRKGLREATKHMNTVLFHPNICTHSSFVFLSSDIVVGAPHNVIALDTQHTFAVLQSRIHEVWARRESSSLEDRLRYSPTDCFETFPFPTNFETAAALEDIGRRYYDSRAALMLCKKQGLTTTYNRFHDPAEGDAGILKLHELHDAMDRAVLDAYGWGEIETICGFGLDYLDVEDEDMPEDVPEQLWWPTAAEALAFAAKLPQTRRRLPWRYRWPEETRDEVLARLLELNKQRAEEERRTGQAAAAAEKKKAKRPKRGRKKKDVAGQMALGDQK